MYIVGLVVSRCRLFTRARSLSSSVNARTGCASFNWGRSLSSRSALSATASLSPLLAVRITLVNCFSQDSKSASASSVLIVSISASGSILLATWITLGSSKQRTTWAIASVSRMLAKNWLPRPSPFEAPATSPAISTNSIVAGMLRSGLTKAAISPCRGSGMGTTPVLGSIVQNGKFSASIPA